MKNAVMGLSVSGIFRRRLPSVGAVCRQMVGGQMGRFYKPVVGGRAEEKPRNNGVSTVPCG